MTTPGLLSREANLTLYEENSMREELSGSRILPRWLFHLSFGSVDDGDFDSYR